MLGELAKAESSEGFLARVPHAVELLRGFVRHTLEGRAGSGELVLTVRLSRPPETYRVRSLNYAAVRKLKKEGKEVRLGEKVRYMVRDFKARRLDERVEVEPFGGEYDREHYVELLLRAGESLLLLFSYDREVLRKLIL